MLFWYLACHKIIRFQSGIAITDYRASIYVRKLEQTAYDLADEGSQLERLRHARRIAQEEAFLAKLMKALGKSLDKYKCK